MLASNFEPRRRRGFEIASREWRGNGESRETVFVVSMSIRARVLREHFVFTSCVYYMLTSRHARFVRISINRVHRVQNAYVIYSLDVAHSRRSLTGR